MKIRVTLTDGKVYTLDNILGYKNFKEFALCININAFVIFNGISINTNHIMTIEEIK